MAEMLLQTKHTIPPIRDKLVPRAPLLDRLNAGLWHAGASLRKLPLVSAPPGYGKTTLVVQWLRGLDCRVAWLSLDAADKDPSRFLAHLISAVQPVPAAGG